MERPLPHVSPPRTEEEGSRLALGIGLGASSVSLVQVRAGADAERPSVVHAEVHPNEGNPQQTLLRALRAIDPARFDRIAVTGRSVRHRVRLSSLPEPEAVEHAYRFAKPDGIDCSAVVSAGGETFMVYELDAHGHIANVITGNKCASGTGEFLIQQLRRMHVTIEEAARWEVEENPYTVSGRCSVFCKSDCTHATNKGVRKQQVVAGLCRMMAGKILELLKHVDQTHLMLVGGTSRNRMMVAYLRREIENLIIPDQAFCFEALGAALWAIDRHTAPFPGLDALFRSGRTQRQILPPLAEFRDQVQFKTLRRAAARPGDTCLLGLDVGSTTTKAVLLRKEDSALLASVYLRTNGDPVGASRACYRALYDQLDHPEKLHIESLGVCGSGRQIAGLHALTHGVINEISAHATAAAWFDRSVDTIFEIGGQDAKYTYLTEGVPSDYAMNEACSAGTGSFLEEAAFETLGVPLEEIAGVALRGRRPPNFNDHCAAFIASDVKRAMQEGASHADLVAGLVYSICKNYINRVKGNRPVGSKIFVQGGVCYNRAIPPAMAALLGKPIVVPPEPGLMGAFGVALEAARRIEAGLLDRAAFNLGTLANREVRYGDTFVCRGGKERCDRKCKVSILELDGKKYPFGGACNRYVNARFNVAHDVQDLDMVQKRQQLVFREFAGGHDTKIDSRKRVGIQRSFLTHTYYPLYSTFFAALGWQPVIPATPTQRGMERRNAAFCHPVELAHGFFHSLLSARIPPDYIFLPHVKAMPRLDQGSPSWLCPFVQAEPYYLQNAFREEIEALQERGTTCFSPILDLTEGLAAARAPLVEMAMQAGVSRPAAEKAFRRARERQEQCRASMLESGREALARLEAHPDQTAVVLFSRPYNGLAEEANMGIARKLASRGVRVIPLDFLAVNSAPSAKHMYWGLGQRILRAARIVKNHPQLYGVYVTNFSCGPDSFLLGYFRDLMERKPSLTLELDNHTADAGIETRIEAFLDIVAVHRRSASCLPAHETEAPFTPARVLHGRRNAAVRTSSGTLLPLRHSRVRLLIPSMGRLSSEALAAVFRASHMRAEALPPPDDRVLKTGRAHLSCKECLPLILTAGALLDRVHRTAGTDEVLLYFMATASGPCRFGQYSVFLENMVRRLRLPDVALLSPTSEDSYGGMGYRFVLRAWSAAIVSDVMEDIRSMLLANAVNRDEALAVFEEEWTSLLQSMETGRFAAILEQTRACGERLARIPLQRPCHEVPVIALTGEIYVRRDGLSRRHLTEQLAARGFAVTCSPVIEWLHYCDYMLQKKRRTSRFPGGNIAFKLRRALMRDRESRLKSALARSGLVSSALFDIHRVVRTARPYVSDHLAGEAILTVGSSLAEIVSHACGVITIGPFGCMPNRISESILSRIMHRRHKLAAEPDGRMPDGVLDGIDHLPFLAIESDGAPFPQLIEAQLETFCLRAARLHERMLRTL